MQMIQRGLFGHSLLRPALIALLLISPLACGFTTKDWPGTTSNTPPQPHVDEIALPPTQRVPEALGSQPSARHLAGRHVHHRWLGEVRDAPGRDAPGSPPRDDAGGRDRDGLRG